MHFLKTKYPAIILIVALAYGFYLRSYHIDYPSVGYHNMKENQHLSETLNFYKTGISIHRQVYFQEADRDIPYYEEYPQLPFIPAIGDVLWKIFGVSYWLMRIQMIAYSLGTIVISCIFVKRLTDDTNLSLLTAVYMAIMPLNVFFGRNIQPESPCLFFVMLFYLLFFEWVEKPSFKYSFLSALSLSIAAMAKMSFLVPAIAVIGFIPLRETIKKVRAAKMKSVYGFLIFATVPFYVWLTKITNINETLTEGSIHKIKIFEPFTLNFWKINSATLMSFFVDNYTIFNGILMFGGLLLLPLAYKKARGFFSFYLISLVCYISVFNFYFKEHSYYQMPYVFLAAFLMAYCVNYVFSHIFKNLQTHYITALSLIVPLLSLTAVNASLTRQYDKQFFGIDVAGQYIKTHTAEKDRFLLTVTAQKLGVCYFAERFCLGTPDKPEAVEAYEKKFNSKYIFVHVSSFSEFMKLKSWLYIEKNYRIVQGGFTPYQGQMVLNYLILEKGGVFSMDDLKKSQPFFAKSYELKNEAIPFYTVTLVK
ncbi:MAG: glycosyltransferase family 39 protein [Nitrospirae bacterium]|nr:glycosyltransferase family 39 protein [Nitrospirota bacterium]MBF0533411.1 glycosyltransferase family 39 protein [Nitrospirota bacterium]MBF0616063.1 glycosyltransferase family 39 protein [Nitrospirota bacterium]